MAKWKLFKNQTPVSTFQSGDDAARASAYAFCTDLSARFGLVLPARYALPTPDGPGVETDGLIYLNVPGGRFYSVLVTGEAEDVAADILAAFTGPGIEDYVGEQLPLDYSADPPRVSGMPPGGGF